MRRSRNQNQKVGVHRKFDIATGRAKRGLPALPDQRRQAAALVFRVSEDPGLEILLLTSRGTGRAVSIQMLSLKDAGNTVAPTARPQNFEG